MVNQTPVIRPVKCVLEVCDSQATTTCGNLNLCNGLPASIEGAVHAVTVVVAAATVDEEAKIQSC